VATFDFDVVVVGAGTAGAAAAAFYAEAGMRTALLDSRPFTKAGASWINGVPAWMFERSGAGRPEGDEVFTDVGDFVVAGRSAAFRLELGKRPILGVDMRRLVARLQGRAIAAGATTFERVNPIHLLTSGHGAFPRATALTVEFIEGSHARERMTFKAPLFVDATGMKQALLRLHPGLSDACPPVTPEDTCIAAQKVFTVRDRAGAEAFLAARGLKPGDSIALTGIAGGFSTLATELSPDLSHVAVLTGTIHSGQFSTGTELMRGFVAGNPWIGTPVLGGAGFIPLRRPYAHQAVPGLALIGNAGCQVMAAHGSGIGTGMIAARILFEQTAHTPDPGSRTATWAYQHAFHRELGPMLAGFDVFRRFSQTLTPDESNALMEHGLLSKTAALAAMDQRLPQLPAGEIAQLARRLPRVKTLGARLIATLARMQTAAALAKAFPSRPNEKATARWDRAMAAITGV
jgi:menaquinone-9 beta-reductase